jgi:hypothetical protein
VSNTTARRILKVAGILLIVTVGLVHLRGAPPHYRFAPYLGVSFVANFIGALVAAVGLYRDALWAGCLVLWSPVGRW